jgi:hypothetical protein
MSVPKKSLIGDREVTKKPTIVSSAEPTSDTGSLKASALTAHSMKKKSTMGRASFAALKKSRSGAAAHYKAKW